MIVNKTFKVVCRACGEEFLLYNYRGLDEGSRMGSHHCKQSDAWWRLHPRARRVYWKEKEVPSC